jgi:deazaflavin-dependent oxidoreductase (nitroreductase family)
VTAIEALADTEFCYLTTRGRKTGRPHRIEIWFVAHDDAAFLLSDTDTSDWCRNLLADPRVTLEIAGERRDTVARPVDPGEPDNAVVRPAMLAKYGSGQDLTEWSQTGWLARVEWPAA